jgi:hypothetical protein
MWNFYLNIFFVDILIMCDVCSILNFIFRYDKIFSVANWFAELKLQQSWLIFIIIFIIATQKSMIKISYFHRFFI